MTFKRINVLSRREFRSQFLTEKLANQSYSSGCIMGYFDTQFDNPEIAEDDLYNDDENRYGLEIEPHVTVLYGLQDNEIDEDEVVRLFTMITGPEVSASDVSLFENDKYDVVKWDVESDELVILNKMVTSMFPYKNDYPDYHAHVTIAYCNPSSGKKYVQKLDTPLTKKIAYWVYSKADGKKIKIVPGTGPEVLREGEDSAKDESFTYKGFDVNLKPWQRDYSKYMCTVYRDGQYVMGIKGPMPLQKCREAAVYYVDKSIERGKI